MKYFAYGSNMSQEQMKQRCPDSVLVGKSVLKDYKISFTIFSKKRNCGCADIVKSENEEVWGLLYNISDDDLKLLDKFEGHPKHYRRLDVAVNDLSGNVFPAISYEVVNKESKSLKPSKHYLGLMKDAANEFDFPQSYQDKLSQIETSD